MAEQLTFTRFTDLMLARLYEKERQEGSGPLFDVTEMMSDVAHLGVPPAAGGEDITRAALVGDSVKQADDLLKNGRRPTSRSSEARDLILNALEQAPDRQMESDALDALIAERTGLAARTVQNQRSALKNDGLIRITPHKDEHGAVTRWLVTRTNAPRDSAPYIHPGPPHPDPHPDPAPGTEGRDVDGIWGGLEPHPSTSLHPE